MGVVLKVLDGEITSYLKVERASGAHQYLKVVDEDCFEITKDEYEEATA